MKPSVLLPVLRDAIRHKRNIFLVGQPGCAKTELVHLAARLEGAEVMTIITSLRDPTDANGLPFKVYDENLGMDVVKFLPTSELARMISTDKPLVVFFDELPNAPMSVQASFCNLIQAKTQNGHKVSDKVCFFMAGNRREDKTGAGAVSTAFKNRTLEIKVDIDVRDWVSWGIDNGMPDDLLAYIYARPDWLTAFKAEPNEQQPTPRSIANVGTMLVEMEADKSTPSVNILQELIAGYAGIAFARDFVSAREIIKQIPDPNLALEHPETCPIPDKPIAKHAILNSAAKIVDRSTLGNAFVYVKRFDAEFQRAFATFITARDASLKETSAYIQWETGRTK
jgi:hypothetical protein